MRCHRIQTYRAADGWRSRAHANGRIVADSGQGYDSKRDARKGLVAAAAQLAKAAVGITIRA